MNILVVGTSHSESSCAGANASGRLEFPDRWHDYFQTELGHSVTCFAKSGCTVQQQFDAINSYLQDHPESYWDLVIIEGRSMNPTVSYPGAKIKNLPKLDIVENKHRYHHWLDGDDAHKSRQYFDFWNQSPHSDINVLQWYDQYVLSKLHAVDVWCANLALCSLLGRHALHVRWFSLHHSELADAEHLSLGQHLLAPYLLPDAWPELSIPRQAEWLCDCRHFNVKGNQVLWQAVKSRLQQQGII